MHRSAIVEVPQFMFCLVLAAGISGCGASVDPGPELIPVEGTAKLDGKPLAGATIVFHPRPETAGNGGFAVTDEEGKFTVTDNFGNPGCPAGDYGVTFSKLTQPDGSPVPSGPAGDQVDKIESMPKVYTIFKPFAIVQGAEVKPPSTKLDFVLDSKLKPPPALYR